MTYLRNFTNVKILSLIILLSSLIIYIFPFLNSVEINESRVQVMHQGNDNLSIPLIRCLIFAFVITFILVSISMIIAIMLSGISITSKWKLILPVLLIPVVLGNVSTAFIWKLLLLNNASFFQTKSIKFFTLGCIQFWQYGTFFIYLFWLNQQSIKNERVDYASIVRLSTWEKIRDIILPKHRNIATLLFVVGFIFSFYEDAKIQFIFRASRGTDMEMVSQWLNRTYESDVLINSDFAFRNVSSAGFIVLLLALAGLVLSLIICNLFFNALLSLKGHFVRHKKVRNLSKTFAFILLNFTLLPILAALFKQMKNVDFSVSSLAFPLGLTVLAAFFATVVAITFGILSRLFWMKILSDFNRLSLMLLILLFLLLFVPPIITLVTGFKWMQFISYVNESNIYIAWIVGHIILSFPLLAGFAIVTHFQVRNIYVDYLRTHVISPWEKAKQLFILPFRADYLLIFLMAISIIWNESVINSILSDSIPSFVTELNKTISGKGSDYSNGIKYLLVSLVLGGGCIWVWTFIVSRITKIEI